MKILTWDTLNFGDRINDWIWHRYIPDLLDDDESDLLVGVGSLLNHRLPVLGTKQIFGSGVGHGELPEIDDTWKIHWIRGPRTANALRISHDKVITDGGVLIRDLFAPVKRKEFGVSMLCHCSACENQSLQPILSACNYAGINFINPELPSLEVIDLINRSTYILTEALHGAIVSDALRIPWAPLSRKGVLQFKWQDWMESLGLKYKPVKIPYRPQWFIKQSPKKLSRKLLFPVIRPLSSSILAKQFKYLKENAKWRLSETETLDRKVNEMVKKLKELSVMT